MLELTDKACKVAVIIISEELKGTIPGEIEESIGTISHHIQNGNKEMEIVKKKKKQDPMDIPELKITVTEMKRKITREACSRFEPAEERAGILEKTSVEIM